MKKYCILVLLLTLISIAYKSIYAGEIMKSTKNHIFYNELLKLEKNNAWVMLRQQSERMETFYKEIFEILSFEFKNIKKIDINLYTPKEWPSKNLYHYALSPDGKEIAFVISERDASFNLLYSLYILNINTGNIENILPPNQFYEISNISYLPDGKTIFFVGKKRQIIDTSDIPQFNSIYTINLKTNQITEVVRYKAYTIDFQSSSPDGKKIVYENSNLNEINICDLITKTSYKLVDGKYPTWLPKRNKISYLGKDGNYYLINPNGSNNELFILNKPLHKFKLFGEKIGRISGALLWSPEEKYVYYERTTIRPFADVETYLPYIMNVTTKKEKELPDYLSNIKCWIGKPQKP